MQCNLIIFFPFPEVFLDPPTMYVLSSLIKKKTKQNKTQRTKTHQSLQKSTKTNKQTNKPWSAFCVDGLLLTMRSIPNHAQSLSNTISWRVSSSVPKGFPSILSVPKIPPAVSYRYRCHQVLNKSYALLNLERNEKAIECAKNGNICSVTGLCFIPDSELIYGDDDFA